MFLARKGEKERERERERLEEDRGGDARWRDGDPRCLVAGTHYSYMMRQTALSSDQITSSAAT